MSGSQRKIDLYVDPCCPFAWIAYQWLAEVRRHRAVELGLHLMSLPTLNEHQPISRGYRRLLAHTWGPARVAAVAVHQHWPGRTDAAL
jgi:predicted DsbA family dithiol-disulfide isomerase